MARQDQDKVLVVCAHPDDETLGLGGTLKNHSRIGDEVNMLCFADGQYGRDLSDNGIKKRQNQAISACKVLGIKNIQFLNYRDQFLETIPLVELVGKIEMTIKKVKPTIIYTHFWGDINQDHKRVFEATSIATRPKPGSKIKRVIVFETPSSTEWANKPEIFQPNLFVNIRESLSFKINAFKKYSNEIENFPHPRSIDAIINRSKYWGARIGLKNAEAFIIIRQIC